jgi:hypothetical protein
MGGFKARLVIKDGRHWLEYDREEYDRAYEDAVLRHYFPEKPESLWRFCLNRIKSLLMWQKSN